MKRKSLVVKTIIHKSLLKHLKNNRVKKIFKVFKNNLDQFIHKKNTIGVAISGGPDSLALAFLTKCYLLKNNFNGKFFIVDHGLRKESNKDTLKVKKILDKFDINCEILKWRGKKPISNIQSIARNERYKLLKNACKKRNINHLLVGHHLDDLYENFFIRLLRGSGLKGLSSFGETIKDDDNFIILRPLIKLKKEELIFTSKLVFNFFIEDPFNKNPIFQRSRIRKLIADLDKEGLNLKKLNLTIKNLKSANESFNFFVRENIKNNTKLIKYKNMIILNQNFFNQPDEVIFRSISLVLKKISKKYYPPRGKSIVNSIITMKSLNFKKFTIGGCFVEKVNETIFITAEN